MPSPSRQTLLCRGEALGSAGARRRGEGRAPGEQMGVVCAMEEGVTDLGRTKAREPCPTALEKSIRVN